LQAAFIDQLKDYNAKGTLDVDPTGPGIPIEQLGNLFTYEYNVVEGVDFDE
jgi:hypothetical protein